MCSFLVFSLTSSPLMYQWRVAGGFERSEVQFTDTYLKNKLLQKITFEFVLVFTFSPKGRPRISGAQRSYHLGEKVKMSTNSTVTLL